MVRCWIGFIKAARLLAILIVFTIASFAQVRLAHAAQSGVTYQGRILRPDGTAYNATNVQFRMQIRTPDANNCLMYEELHSPVDLSATGGNFSLTISDGLRQDTTGFGLEKVFANRGTFNFDGATCTTGNTYAPNSGDGRSLQVYFKDPTMASWEPMPAQRINFVPFAFESKQIAGYGVRELLHFDLTASPLKNSSPLSEAQYDKLIALINGSSGDYEKAGQLAGSSLPAFGVPQAGKVLGWSGTGWVGVDAQTTTSSVLKDPDGGANTITFTADSALTQNYTVTWPLNPGTGAGQVLTTDGTGKLTWTNPLSSQWTAGTPANSIAYTAGNVGIGTNNPQYNLDVPGASYLGTMTTSNSKTTGAGAAISPTTIVTAYTNSGAPQLLFQRYRGTTYAAPSPVANFDVLGRIQGTGYNGTTMVDTANINFIADGLDVTGGGANLLGGRMDFQVRGPTHTGSGGGVTAMTIRNSGNIGMGVISPTAGLHLKEGVATAGGAPLKLSSGPVTTTAEAGAIEYDGTNLFFTDSANTRRVLSAVGAPGVGDFMKDGSVAMTGGLKVGTNSISNAGSGGLTFDAVGRGTLQTTNGGVANVLNLANSSSTSGAGTAMSFNNGGVIMGSIGAVVGASTSESYMRFETRGSNTNDERARIDSLGRLGVGVTGPSAMLHLKAGTIAPGTSPLKLSSGPVMTTPEDGAIEYDGSNFFVTVGATRRALVSSNGGATTFTGNIYAPTGLVGSPSISFTGDTDTGFWRPTADTIAVSTAGAERMRVDANGNVGIGTALPTQQLELTKNLWLPGATGNTNGNIFLGGDPSVNQSGLRFWYNDALFGGAVDVRSTVTNGGLAIRVDNGNGSLERMRITNTGNVGVGTAAPVAKLDVQGGSIRSVASTGSSYDNVAASADWSRGNNQSMSVDCAATTFTNMLDGATYNLLVTETGTSQCVFTHAGLTFHYTPANSNRLNSQLTIYSFTRIGTRVVVSWNALN